MASALSTFNDFVNITGPAYLTSAEMVVNEATKNNYLLRRFLRGHAPSDLVQGGATIKDTVLGDEQSTFQFYQPNETFTWTNPQVLTNWEVNWRFAVDHMSWTDQEIELNLGGGLSRATRHHMYKRLKYTKEQRVWTSILNGMEDHLFAVPEVANMETASGTEPYSIPAFVNEQANGQFYTTTNDDHEASVTGKTAWTTVQGIDPSTNSWWVPQQVDYTASTVSAASDNIIAAFDSMFLDVQFIAPPTKEQYFENGDMFAQFIACSKRGQTVYQQLLRDSQDTFVTTSRQDPAFIRPQYAGIDLEYAPILDTALLYANETATSALVTEVEAAGTGEDNGPRYYWLNGKYLRPIWHTSRYMFKHPVMRHPNQPFTSICPIDSWYNIVCRSRQRQGIVSPIGDLYS